MTGICQKNGKVCGVTAINKNTGETIEIACSVVVNAAGSWSGRIAALAGLDVAVSPDRGTLVVFNHRFTSRVVNRLHPGSDGDIFVPHGSITILGTTSIPTDRPDDTTPTSEEVLRLLKIGEPLFPDVRSYRILRAFAGTRPLYTPGGAAGRKASRNFQPMQPCGRAGISAGCCGQRRSFAEGRRQANPARPQADLPRTLPSAGTGQRPAGAGTAAPP